MSHQVASDWMVISFCRVREANIEMDSPHVCSVGSRFLNFATKWDEPPSSGVLYNGIYWHITGILWHITKITFDEYHQQ